MAVGLRTLNRMADRFRLVIALCLACWASLALAQTTELETDTDALISASIYAAKGKHLVLWLPSERGMQGEFPVLANALAERGLDVWAIDLHSSFMLPVSRHSLAEVDRDDVLSLLRLADARGFSHVTLMTSGRGADMTLELAQRWRQSQPQQSLLRGHIFFTPNLMTHTPAPGEQATYTAFARNAQLPVLLIQPEFSTKYARSDEIAEVLRTGGSPVALHRLPGVRGGFQRRPQADLKPIDVKARAAVATTIAAALAEQSQQVPARLASVGDAPDKQTTTPAAPPWAGQTLRPFRGDPVPPPLRLPLLDGDTRELSDYHGKVVLVNFWASWCGPCAEEIPSLSRLVTRLSDKPFAVLTVNIGEDEPHIRDFLQDFTVNFDTLLDRDSQAVRDWGVYAYPTNFLIDASGRITHTYLGALTWDAPEVVSVIEALF